MAFRAMGGGMVFTEESRTEVLRHTEAQRESKSERNVFTIAKQVFKNRAVRCLGISSWALGFENHIVAHCIMRKSSA